ncbi:hypothetical protein SAICODRAFT_74890 [Saitoella complicata NRRL Y-17804]|nr:uncharacterized protein SAICODRAFT_74890 [Saitoella complicata NRRL Y-17804]ODQ56394.1 hypothetical protein SAICODRAFT_74890 [Saitoella complicata NRRL Y-17804]
MASSSSSASANGVPDFEARQWDRLAVRMEGFHSYFRVSFNSIYDLADKFEDQKITLQDFVDHALELDSHLHTHHSIEDIYIFPILGKRMPAFAPTGTHPEHHRRIHEGLEQYVQYLKAVRAGAEDYDAKVLREKLAAFRGVLFEHLDEEVEHLRGENMRKYWTLDEVRRLPM